MRKGGSIAADAPALRAGPASLCPIPPVLSTRLALAAPPLYPSIPLQRDAAVSMSTSDLPASSVPPCVLLRGGASGPFVESGSRMCYHWEKILADRKRRTAPIYFSAPVCRRRCSIRTLHRLRSRSIADCWKMERWMRQSGPIQPQSRMEHMGAVWAERGRTIQASGREPARRRRPPDRSAR